MRAMANEWCPECKGYSLSEHEHGENMKEPTIKQILFTADGIGVKPMLTSEEHERKSEIFDDLIRRGVIVVRSEEIFDGGERTRVSWIEHGCTRDMDVPNYIAEEYLGL